MRKEAKILAIALLFFTLLLPRARGEETVTVSFPAEFPGEELAAGYIDAVLAGESSLLEAARPSGYALFAEGTPNRALYEALREKVSAVASGRESSTAFSFSARTLFTKYTFSAEDLGVETLFTEDDKVTAEAARAYKARVTAMKAEIDLRAVVYSVREDSPYEMFWAYKNFAIGNGIVTDTVYRVRDEDLLIISGSVQVTMYVSQDYADLTDWDGEYKSLTEVDTEKYGQVAAAKENIERILQETAALSDEEKIMEYGSRICAMTSYNYAAVNDNLPYGDPWQLIWVFDGDPDTQVVCEGYAKAFSYLCDLGTAETEAILCQGYLNYADKNAHMWNIVSLAGHNYLVDLTNYDLGYDLMLVGYASGSVADGYATASGLKYYYNRTYTPRSDAELTLAPYSYAEWKAARNTAPAVTLSSLKTVPGYGLLVRWSGKVPVSELILLEGEEEEILPLEGDTALLAVTGDREIRFAVEIDGQRTPATDVNRITLLSIPETESFSPPVGSVLEEEAFAGAGFPGLTLQDNRVDTGAFADNTALRYVRLQGAAAVSAGAFRGCTGLEMVKTDGEASFEEGAFPGGTLLLVPDLFDFSDGGYPFAVALSSGAETEETPENPTEWEENDMETT